MRYLFALLLTSTCLAQIPTGTKIPTIQVPPGPLIKYPQINSPVAIPKPKAAASMSVLALNLAPGVAKHRVIPSDAALIIGVNMKTVRESGLMQTALQQFSGLGTSLPQANLAEFQQKLPMLNDLDSVLVAATGFTPADEGIILLTGRFTNPEWATALKNAGPGLAQSNAVLLGSPRSLPPAAAALRATTPAPDTTMARRVSAYAANYDFWMIADQAPFASEVLRRMPGSMRATSAQIRGMEFGVAFRESTVVLITLMTPSMPAADQLEATLRSQMRTTRSKQADVEIQRLNTAIRLSIVGQGNAIFTPRPEATNALAEATAKPPAQPGKVVIYGLESSPKTVTIK
jgi:hypothetical protein